MRYLPNRPNRLKIDLPKTATKVTTEALPGHDVVTATGKRGSYQLITRAQVNRIGQVYVTATWRRIVPAAAQGEQR